MGIGQAIQLAPKFIYKGFFVADSTDSLCTIIAPCFTLCLYAGGQIVPARSVSVLTYLPSWFFVLIPWVSGIMLVIGAARLWRFGYLVSLRETSPNDHTSPSRAWP